MTTTALQHTVSAANIHFCNNQSYKMSQQSVGLTLQFQSKLMKGKCHEILAS